MKKTILLLFCIFLANSIPLLAEQKSFSITVVGTDKNDSRFFAAEEAVTYWNQELDKLGINIHFKPITHLIEPNIDHVLLQIRGAKDLQEMRRCLIKFEHISGDIIIVLSDSDIISFALTRLRCRKGLIGVRPADIVPLSLPNVSRNVVAHELGHVLGLRHNSDPTMLMCGRPAACHPSAFTSDKDFFFPLTESDKKILRELQW
ncbi:matrixin family metalloprotease [Thermodesulfobacteriota bacterium]